MYIDVDGVSAKNIAEMLKNIDFDSEVTIEFKNGENWIFHRVLDFNRSYSVYDAVIGWREVLEVSYVSNATISEEALLFKFYKDGGMVSVGIDTIERLVFDSNILKPCPFCANEVTATSRDGEWQIIHPDEGYCPIHQSTFCISNISLLNLIDDWNYRKEYKE